MTQTVLLGELIEVVKGISYRSRDYSDSQNGIAFVNLKSVERNGGYKHDGIKYYAGEFKDSQYVEPGDILIANTDLTQNREIIGSPMIMPDIGREACFSLDLSKLVIKDPSQLDKSYLFYYLKSPIARDYMISHSNGSTVVHLSVKSVPNMEINLPTLEKQKKIADILGTIDEKIELNRQMNQTLEQIGQALFRHYFIDNPDAKGWGVVNLGSKIKPKRGKSLTSKDMRQGTVPVVSGGLQPAGTHSEPNTKSPVITISASGANAGFTALWGEDVWSADSSYIDATITPHVYFYYLFLTCNQKRIYEMQTGSGQPHIYPSHIELLEVPDAPEELVNRFSGLVAENFEKIEENKREMNSLIILRDSLLPKLISGDLEI